jgi:hypothetical protein
MRIITTVLSLILFLFSNLTAFPHFLHIVTLFPTIGYPGRQNLPQYGQRVAMSAKVQAGKAITAKMIRYTMPSCSNTHKMPKIQSIYQRVAPNSAIVRFLFR